jgi:hypothetical protein
MLFRKALFFFLAANASAFVIRPTTLSRSATAFLPIASSLSNPDTDTNQEAAEEKTPSTGDVIEASEVGVSTDSEETDKSEAAAPSEDNSSSSLKAGQTKRNTIYVGNLPFSKLRSHRMTCSFEANEPLTQYCFIKTYLCPIKPLL